MKVPYTRDDFVELRDIAYYDKRAKMEVWHRDSNDFKNVRI